MGASMIIKLMRRFYHGIKHLWAPIILPIIRAIISMRFVYGRPRISLIYENAGTDKSEWIDLVTIAFNKSELIKEQYRLLKKNLTDSYCWYVIDNSNNITCSADIMNFCIVNKINYLQPPKQSSGNPSISHGLALNWATRNIVKNSDSRYCGYLDHDIFPVEKNSLIYKLLKQPLYGHLQSRNQYSYLWPGFCFFDKHTINIRKLNFLPNEKLGLDTGGHLTKLVALHKAKMLIVPRASYMNINQNYGDVHNGCVEKINGWIHLINGSEWKNVHQDRKLNVMQFIGQF